MTESNTNNIRSDIVGFVEGKKIINKYPERLFILSF